MCEEEKIEKIEKQDYYNWIPGVECIDIAKYFSFALGCAIKYIWRAGRKDGATKIQDLKKAIKNIEFEIEKEDQKTE